MKIAIRMDDITPDMNWENFLKLKEIFDKYFLRKLSFLERDVLIAPDIGAAKKANEIL